MTEVDIANRALAKIHVVGQDTVTSSDGTLANATSTGIPTDMAKLMYTPARRQILRMAHWTCAINRQALASEEREASTAYAVGDLIVGENTNGFAVYTCTVAGTSGTGSVTWPTSGTVSDGAVTWTYAYAVKQGIPADYPTIYAFPLPDDYITQVEIVDQYQKNTVATIEGMVLYSDTGSIHLVYVKDETDPDRWDPLLQEAIIMHLASLMAYPVTGSHENEVALAQAAAALVYQATIKTARERRQGQKVGSEWFSGLFDRGQP